MSALLFVALAHRRSATRLWMRRYQVLLSEGMRTYRMGHV